MLVLLMRAIYEVRDWDGLPWHDINIKFYSDYSRHSGNIKFIITSTIWEAAVLELLKDLRSMSLRWPQMAWHINAKFHDDQFKH
jgi:hypothetical protein